MALRFDILARSPSTRARVGRVTTPHGSFDTPAFMPVGTQGTIKGLALPLVAATGSQIILGNTYHLMLRPGSELVAKLGGLHAFAGWPGPMLTDSGGFQAYSMSDLNTVTDDGVTFRSVVDGSKVELTPERSIRVQNELGADIIMAFDDCPPSIDPTQQSRAAQRLMVTQQKTVSRSKRPYDHAQRLDEANERTVRWLERCKRAHARPDDQSLFGIVQGGTDLDRRSRSARDVTGVDLPGYAIGGVAVGEGFDQIVKVVEHTARLLPESRPRYLMGVGYERDIVAAVRAGVDMFDCVLPTRNGRNANAFTPTGTLRLRNAQYADDPRPLDESCDCLACAPAQHGWVFPASPDRTTPEHGGLRATGVHSRAYLRHLFMAKEMLGPILVSLHNVRHFQRLMVDIRSGIREDDWSALARQWPVISAVSAPASDDPASPS
ncbi:MAG: tRNA guanosine(34) transglycosylase Tgt [Phycisphaerales bacterium]